jgi:hypothetical protein
MMPGKQWRSCLPPVRRAPLPGHGRTGYSKEIGRRCQTLVDLFEAIAYGQQLGGGIAKGGLRPGRATQEEVASTRHGFVEEALAVIAQRAARVKSVEYLSVSWVPIGTSRSR